MENENELDFYGGGEGGEGPLRAADMVPLVEREAAPGDLAELLLELQHDPIWTFEVTLHSGEAARYLPGGMDVAHLRGRIEAAGLAPRLFVPTPERVSWLVRARRTVVMPDGSEQFETRKEVEVECNNARACTTDLL